jgi:hypothetical protein
MGAREVLYGGQASGGKSWLLRAYATLVAISVPGAQIYLFRKAYDELFSNHIQGTGGFVEMLEPLTQTGQAKILYSNPPQVVFKNKSSIMLRQVSDFKQANEKYRGPEMHVLLIDEASIIEWEAITFLRSRVRIGSLNVPQGKEWLVNRIILASNPGGISSDAIRREFMEKSPGEMKIWNIHPNEGGWKRVYIPASAEDNYIAMKNNPDYKQSLMGLGNEKLIRAMMEGDWTVGSGAFFADSFHKDHNVLEPFPLPKDKVNVYRGYDYGYTAPYSVLYIAKVVDPFLTPHGKYISKDSIIVMGEIYGGVRGKTNKGLKQTIKQQAARIKQYEALPEFKNLWSGKIEAGVADNSIFADGNELSFAKQFEKEGIKFVKGTKGQGSIAVGLSTIKTMLKAAGDEITSKEQPCLYLFDNCWNLINIIQRIEPDEKNEDVVVNGSHVNDHAKDKMVLQVVTSVEKTSLIRWKPNIHWTIPSEAA